MSVQRQEAELVRHLNEWQAEEADDDDLSALAIISSALGIIGFLLALGVFARAMVMENKEKAAKRAFLTATEQNARALAAKTASLTIAFQQRHQEMIDEAHASTNIDEIQSQIDQLESDFGTLSVA